MMKRLLGLIRHCGGAAAAEMVLVTPMLLILLFGSVELGNMLLDEHALEKQVRDGARFAARMQLNSAYNCPGTVFQDANAADTIIKVTKDGVVSGTGNPRWVGYWARTCNGQTPTLAVSVRCVAKSDIDTDATGYTGIYTSLGGSIPVVTVTGAVKYRSLFNAIGFDGTNVCLRAKSEAAVQGL